MNNELKNCCEFIIKTIREIRRTPRKGGKYFSGVSIWFLHEVFLDKSCYGEHMYRQAMMKLVKDKTIFMISQGGDHEPSIGFVLEDNKIPDGYDFHQANFTTDRRGSFVSDRHGGFGTGLISYSSVRVYVSEDPFGPTIQKVVKTYLQEDSIDSLEGKLRRLKTPELFEVCAESMSTKVKAKAESILLERKDATSLQLRYLARYGVDDPVRQRAKKLSVKSGLASDKILLDLTV